MMMENKPIDKGEESTRCYLSDAVNSLPVEKQKIIERYYEVVDLLKEEMFKFNSEFGKDILKYRCHRSFFNKPHFYLCSRFVYDCFSFDIISSDIASTPDEPLYFSYSDNFICSNAEILASFHLFLSVVKDYFKKKTNICAKNE